ncbi:MAG: LCP family protein [Actinomycetia bacterium]|nr:LCP family protein [Actinomycetes bacterium]
MTPTAGTRTGVGACALAAFGSVVNPGTGHLAVHARITRATLVASVLNLAATVVSILILGPVRKQADLVEIIADRTVLLGLGVALATMAIARLYTAFDSAWLARPTSSTRLRLAAALAVGVLAIGGVAPLAIAANYAWEADQTAEKVFGNDDATTAVPTPLPTTPVTGSTVAVTGSTIEATTTTEPLFEGESRVNVLLLGGDAGPGRPGLRTDSMVVVSIDSVTGTGVIISIPRNMDDIPFPEGTPLHDKYPEGFDGLANAIYTYGDTHRDLLGGVEDAGAQAIKLGISQLLGIPIHYYVLVDMAGFVDIVDALGGIDIYVPKRMPTPGNPRGAKHPVPEYIEKGQQHMDGTLALAYARTREADDDYHRMSRQQCLLGSLGKAATPMALTLGFTELMSAFGDAVHTDIPRDKLDDFARLIELFNDAGGVAATHRLHLGKPLVDPFRWKPDEIRTLVAVAFAPIVLDIDVPLLEETC